MRRKEKEITSLKEIEEVIQKAQVCHLGLIDGDEPYIIPMSFGYKNNTLYLHSAAEGRKIDVIRKNDKVCFEFETDIEMIKAESACKWSTKYRSVMGTGRAKIIKGNSAKAQGLNIITGHYAPGTYDFPEANLDKVIVIKIDIEKLSGKKSIE
jgi:nitroimidazol reductase NimA-like FMN-containing flavoprotein (pyridoxamine 5'-phosphate oxidase superfamily)